MKNIFEEVASILGKNIVCTGDITEDRNNELIILCKQNKIPINLEKFEASNTYAFSWVGWLGSNKGTIESVFDCPLADSSDDDYQVCWGVFRSMADGSYIIKTKEQYEKIIRGRNKKIEKAESERLRARWDWLAMQKDVDLTCII